MKGSENPYPSVNMEEIASDGSTLSNADADYRRLFLGEDGLLHVKDSAGAVTDPYTAAGSVATDAIWDAAGDLAVGSGANTAAKLTKGSDNDVLTISASTHVPVWAAPAAAAYPTFSGARAYNAGVQSNNGGPNAVTLGAEDFDTASYHDTGSNTSRMTVPATGYYFVKASTYHPSADAYIYLYLNGSKVRGTQSGGASGILFLATSALVYMTSGQYIEMYVYTGGTQNVGHATTVEQMSTLSIFRLA